MSESSSHNPNIYCAYMCNHAQKITEALYRITDVFPDREPLKWHLRKEGILIFKIFLKIEDSNIYERVRYVDKIERTIPHMIQALELASLGTFISRTNFEVLSREYNTLFDFIKDKREELLPESGKTLSMISFEEMLKDNKKESDNMKDKKVFFGEGSRAKLPGQVLGEEDKNDISNRFSQGAYNPRGSFRPLVDKKIKDISQNKEEQEEHSSNVSDANDTRKDKIVSIIRERGEVSVSDVAAYFGGVSEKTIQRELISLAESGVVKKYGDRRWRRYVLSA